MSNYISLEPRNTELIYKHTCWSYCRVSSNVSSWKLFSTTLVNWGASTADKYTDIAYEQLQHNVYTEAMLKSSTCNTQIITLYIYTSTYIYTDDAEFKTTSTCLSETYHLLQEWGSEEVMSVYTNIGGMKGI